MGIAAEIDWDPEYILKCPPWAPDIAATMMDLGPECITKRLPLPRDATLYDYKKT